MPTVSHVPPDPQGPGGTSWNRQKGDKKMKKQITYSAPMLVAGADGKLHVKHVVAPAKSK
jgi:hypothetical protein